MIKTYEALFDTNNKGVYSISLVEDPAMEGDFIALSKENKVELKTVDEEQRILIGLVLEPNKDIYRNQGGEEFNLRFSEETIKDLSHNFFKQGYQTNSSIEHADEVTGVSFVESWIVEDSAIDKSANFGFSYPKGSWVATMKVDDENVWKDYVKTGKVKGFSIDAFLTLKEVKLNKDKQMENNNEIKTGFAKLTDDLMVALKLKKSEETVEVKFGSVQVKDAEGVTVDIMFDGEALEVGSAVWVQGEGEERIALEAGEVPLEDGRTLVIGDDSIIAEIKDSSEEAPVEEEMAAEPNVPNQATIDAIKSVLIKYSEESDKKFEDLVKEMVSFKKVNEDLKLEVVELSNQPAAKAIKSVVTQVELNSKGRILDKLRNNQQ
tara:strand:- start:4496 stop:5629 length:1134 start_codon:yes stop_codon:yes gene_type:complete